MNAAAERINGPRREDDRGENHWEVYPALSAPSFTAIFCAVPPSKCLEVSRTTMNHGTASSSWMLRLPLVAPSLFITGMSPPPRPR